MTDVIVTDKKTMAEHDALFAQQIGWDQQTIDELEQENRELTDVNSKLQSLITGLRERIEHFEKSHMGLQLSGALAEVDRLKQKCNLLNNQLKGKHIHEH